MNVINQATNAWVSGVRVPVGTSEIPFSGEVQIYTTGWGPTNVVVGTGDTLMLWEESFSVQPGYGWAETWIAFFVLGLLTFGTIGSIRRLVRFLYTPHSPWNL
jgi:hypothetical protein